MLPRPTWPISEYSASAPVVDRKTVPIRAMPAALCGLNRKRRPYTGLRAAKTLQSLLRLNTPTTARKPNHTITMLPNTRPMLSVPRDCTENSSRMMIAAMIIVRFVFSRNSGSNTGMVFRPSTAEEIETAGVSTESARNAAPPSIPGIASQPPYLRINEYRAKIPPSPLLSMRMAISTYLTVVIRVIDQNTNDSTPRIASLSACWMPPWPLRKVCIVYSGEVPISPYTTPSATTAIAKVTLFGPDCTRVHQRPIAPLVAVFASFSASLCSSSCCLAITSRSSLVVVLRETLGALVKVSACSNVSRIRSSACCSSDCLD